MSEQFYRNVAAWSVALNFVLICTIPAVMQSRRYWINRFQEQWRKQFQAGLQSEEKK